ncbi:DUF551 domain-containing protein [Klebsiella quasipneumoniae]|uniref:DUF551 domain-containing protein n=1 Tax=Klebsiella quasipneumoniae TaxID=1463165 RepID=UPI00164CAF4D|nr:DUF551 domain-containing protein [Klebsiella quasipneumoniae]MBC5128803.1 DUF551 domain-containing protein [Klebsiella quasipneumoniae]MBC5129426.1 DUF551 domain-containing protein [Klebsiella quasipneumoniae]MBC5205610.1 DUF551 domain-containing protein [Klebsiella quasipneumoniae]
MKDEALLPCPFCGGEPEEDAGGCSEFYGHEHQDYSITCKQCGAEVYCSVGTFEKADVPCSCHHDTRKVCVDKWNKRATMIKEENAIKYWHGLYNEIKGRGRRHEGDFAPDLSMSTEEIINAIDKRRTGNTSNAPAYSDAEKRIADAVELLKKAAPAMLAGNSGPGGPLAGRMKSPVIPDGYVMVAASLLSELRDWAHPKIEDYCEMWAGRRDDEFPALRKVIADIDALLAAAPQSPGSEPASVPGKWIPVSERMPDDNSDVLCTAEFDGPGDWRRKVGYWHEGKWVVYGASWTPTHWMPLPAGPKGVKGE